MKKTDIAMIVLIATISVVAAFFATSALLGEAASETTSVPTIEAISSEIVQPSEAIFNENAINPAVEVQVGSAEQ